MADVEVVGVGMTPFGKLPTSTIRSLGEQAVAEALADAGLQPADVGMVLFANAAAGVLTGQEMIRGQVALRHTGLLGLPMINVENACASGSSAVHLAVTAVASEAVDVALAVGVEKLTHEDKSRTWQAMAAAIDLFQAAELEQALAGDAGSASGPPTDRSLFMDIYAALTKAYMAESGATVRDFAEIAVKSHANAALNPRAQYRTPVTVEQVLESRMVADPLTLLMCSPIGDGAAAVVICSAERAKRLDVPAVRVRSSVLRSGTDRRPGEPAAVERAVAEAYRVSGIGPDELDVLEVHDAAAPAELMLYEELGLCEPGGGPDLLCSGATAMGGKRVVNPSGGLLSKGHPVGATGCAQLVELVEQLRGRAGDRQVAGARTALAHNGGGWLGNDAAAVAVTTLSR